MASSIGAAKWREEKSKFLKNFTKESKNSGIPQQLCCHFNNFFIVWNQQLKCLFAVDINNNEDHCYRLNLLHKVHFTIHHIQASASGSVLLCGPKGVIVVVFPDNVALAHGDVVDCKCTPLGEILLMQTPGLEILAAKWVPLSESFVAILMNDNTIRVFDISSQLSQPDLTIQVIRRSLSLSRMSFSIAAATGGQVVDFDFASPSEIFCLTSTGVVYQISNVIPDDPMEKPKIIGPLVMLPESDDNHGSEGYSILCFSNEGATILVLAGSAGTLYHCLIMEDQDDDPQLFVIEKVRLSLTLTETYDDYQCPIIIEKDMSVSNRYFCLHGSGLHIVVVPFAELLKKFSKDDRVSADSIIDSPSARCLVEHVVCTRATDRSPDDAPLGACVIPTFPSPNLMVLSSQLKMIDISLTRYRVTEAQQYQELLSSETVRIGDSVDVDSLDFEKKIRDILSGSRMPFWAQSEKITDPKELLELTLQTTQIFSDRYLSKMTAVSSLVEFKSNSLRTLKKQQKAELEQLRRELETFKVRSSKLKKKFEDAQSISHKQNVRLHNVIQSVQKKNPSRTNPELVKDVSALDERTQRLSSVLETTKNRLDDLTLLEEREQETGIRGRNESMNKLQLDSLNERLNNSSTDIAALVKDYKSLMDDVGNS